MSVSVTECIFIITRTDAAFGGWCEACGAKLALLAFEGALAPGPNLAAYGGPCGKKFPTEKKSEPENF